MRRETAEKINAAEMSHIRFLFNAPFQLYAISKPPPFVTLHYQRTSSNFVILARKNK